MRDKLREFTAVIDSDERVRALLAVLQFAAMAAATYYAFDQKAKIVCAIVVFVSMGILILVSLLVLFFYRRYDLNALYYQKTTGVLYDRRLNIPNVSLRRKTLQILLTRCHECEKAHSINCLYPIGKDIGSDFVRYFLERKSLGAQRYKSKEELLRTLLRYDSSCGMGRYELKNVSSAPHPRIEISIYNPFTESNGQSDLNPFLLGYLTGLSSEAYGQNFEGKFLQRYTKVEHRVVDIVVGPPNQSLLVPR